MGGASSGGSSFFSSISGARNDDGSCSVVAGAVVVAAGFAAARAGGVGPGRAVAAATGFAAGVVGVCSHPTRTRTGTRRSRRFMLAGYPERGCAINCNGGKQAGCRGSFPPLRFGAGGQGGEVRRERSGTDHHWSRLAPTTPDRPPAIRPAGGPPG